MPYFFAAVLLLNVKKQILDKLSLTYWRFFKLFKHITSLTLVIHVDYNQFIVVN